MNLNRNAVPLIRISLCIFAVSLDAASNTWAQELLGRFGTLDTDSDGRLSKEEAGFAPFFGPADKNSDGFVTFAEAQAYAASFDSKGRNRNRKAGMEGDGAGPIESRVKPVLIEESRSPIRTLEIESIDRMRFKAFWRSPDRSGPQPAVVFVHGGLSQYPDEILRRQLVVNPVVTRMLAAGFVVVQATFRTYENDVQSRGPIEDVRAVVHALAELKEVDARRIAIFGGSGGGSIALELGSDPRVRAVVAGEPATVLYTGMLKTGEYGPRLEIMASPEKFLTPELRERTLEKLKSIRSPVLILHSDQHDLRKLNGPLFLPLMKQAGLRVEYREYPGYGHGFYFGGGDDRWGKGADDRVVNEVVKDVKSFLSNSMTR